VFNNFALGMQFLNCRIELLYFIFPDSSLWRVQTLQKSAIACSESVCEWLHPLYPPLWQSWCIADVTNLLLNEWRRQRIMWTTFRDRVSSCECFGSRHIRRTPLDGIRISTGKILLYYTDRGRVIHHLLYGRTPRTRAHIVIV